MPEMLTLEELASLFLVAQFPLALCAPFVLRGLGETA